MWHIHLSKISPWYKSMILILETKNITM
jgi:hypothetical protein